MILLDTNVLIYAVDAGSPFYEWARGTIADAVAGDGAVVNTVVLAELCVGDAEPETVADRVRSWGVEILDLPSAVAGVCARAFRLYLQRRKEARPVASIPLPDFFIGAHASVMGWTIATADQGKLSTYFPEVPLETPS